jgi:sugar lactone lactonase YvrE
MRPICLGLFLSLMVPAPLLAATTELLVGSWGTHSIRRYDIDSGAYLGDLVAPSSGGLTVPDGMDWGPDGNLYVSSSSTNQVLRFNGESGAFMDVFASDGLLAPGNLKFGPDGLLYVCNKNRGRVDRFDPVSGDKVDTFTTGGSLNTPVGLLWVDDKLLVADFAGGVERYDAATGVFIDEPFNINSPLILNLDKNGDILVSTHTADRIRRFDRDSGASLGIFAIGGTLDCPVGHLFAPDGTLIVASWLNHRLIRYDGDSGAVIGTIANEPGLINPNDLLLRPIPEPASLAALATLFVALRRRR